MLRPGWWSGFCRSEKPCASKLAVIVSLLVGQTLEYSIADATAGLMPVEAGLNEVLSQIYSQSSIFMFLRKLAQWFAIMRLRTLFHIPREYEIFLTDGLDARSGWHAYINLFPFFFQWPGTHPLLLGRDFRGGWLAGWMAAKLVSYSTSHLLIEICAGYQAAEAEC